MSCNTCLDHALIIDIDGTLYNNDHRKHFIEQSPKDWESFHANHIYDQQEIIDLWNSYGIFTIKV